MPSPRETDPARIRRDQEPGVTDGAYPGSLPRFFVVHGDVLLCGQAGLTSRTEIKPPIQRQPFEWVLVRVNCLYNRVKYFQNSGRHK
jgi:hypothetical protein